MVEGKNRFSRRDRRWEEGENSWWDGSKGKKEKIAGGRIYSSIGRRRK